MQVFEAGITAIEKNKAGERKRQLVGWSGLQL